MAAKSEKIKLEEGKETTFTRNGMLVDNSKVEQVKKRKLAAGGINTQIIPGKLKLAKNPCSIHSP